MRRAAACGVLTALTVLLSGCGSGSSGGGGASGSSWGCSSDNPFKCHKHYINPANAKEYDKSIATAPMSSKANLKKMQTVPSAYWIDRYEKIHGKGTGTVEGILKDASSKSPPELVVFIWYDLPNRDCDAKASLGQICCTRNDDGTCDFLAQSDCADGIKEYKSKYADPFVDLLEEYQDKLPIVIVLEPDGLSNLATNLAHPHCGNDATQAAYKQGAKYAITQIVKKAPSVHLYVDAGHGGWLGWESNMGLFMKMLKDLDLPWHKIRGFATNTANYQPLGMQCPWCPDTGYRNGYCLMGKHKDDPCCRDPCGLAKQFNSGNNELNYVSFLANAAWHELGFHAHMIIDTGRNGVSDERKSCSNWCNPRGAGAGIPSTTETANKSLIDAYFWLKTPGESDGCSAMLPTGKPCPRFDDMCGSIDALGTESDEKPAPEAGGWYDFQVKQLASNAQFDSAPHHKIPSFRAKMHDETCPFELQPGQKASDFNYTSAKGEHPCSGPFTQCGGQGWSGPGCCAGTCECKAQGEFNSQCQPRPGLNDCGNSSLVQAAYERHSAVRLGIAGLQGPVSIGLLSLAAVLGALALGRSWRRSRQSPSGHEAEGLRGLGLYEGLPSRAAPVAA